MLHSGVDCLQAEGTLVVSHLPGCDGGTSRMPGSRVRWIAGVDGCWERERVWAVGESLEATGVFPRPLQGRRGHRGGVAPRHEGGRHMKVLASEDRQPSSLFLLHCCWSLRTTHTWRGVAGRGSTEPPRRTNACDTARCFLNKNAVPGQPGLGS